MLTALIWAIVLIIALVFARAWVEMRGYAPNEPPRAWVPEFVSCTFAGRVHVFSPWIDTDGQPTDRCENCLLELFGPRETAKPGNMGKGAER